MKFEDEVIDELLLERKFLQELNKKLKCEIENKSKEVRHKFVNEYPVEYLKEEQQSNYPYIEDIEINRSKGYITKSR